MEKTIDFERRNFKELFQLKQLSESAYKKGQRNCILKSASEASFSLYPEYIYPENQAAFHPENFENPGDLQLLSKSSPIQKLLDRQFSQIAYNSPTEKIQILYEDIYWFQKSWWIYICLLFFPLEIFLRRYTLREPSHD